MEWAEKDNKIEKEYKCEDFLHAIDFINRIAVLAEGLNHHPDILIHSYKNVKITLSTHSEGRVTSKDHELAKKIDHEFSLISEPDLE